MKDIDRFDRKILSALQRDARLTNSELGDLVGLSPSQCSRRRNDLEKRGLILGYHARIDRKLAGYEMLSVIAVTLSHHDETNAARLRELLQRLPNVLSAYALTGQMDYMITVAFRDLEELSEFVNQTLLPHPAVQNVHTAIALETIKDAQVLPV